MNRLFLLFDRYKTSLYFLVLQSIALWLIFVNNKYHNVYAFNTANRYVASYLDLRHELDEYLKLRVVNKDLAEENARLKMIILAGKVPVDSSLSSKSDSVPPQRFKLNVAKVINNSTSESKNYITINKGTIDSVYVDMGVISSNGIVGKVKSSSRHFSTVYSVLHTNNSTSAKLKKTNTEGSISWDGSDPRIVQLKNIPRYVKVAKGDTVMTSSYSDVYPENIMIGRVLDIKQRGEEANLRIKVQLSTDFSSLGYVYIVNHKLKAEKDSLETLIKKEKE